MERVDEGWTRASAARAAHEKMALKAGAKRDLRQVKAGNPPGGGSGGGGQRQAARAYPVVDDEDDDASTVSMYPRAAEEVAPGYPTKDYEAMRATFEQSHFYDINTDQVAEVTDGVLLYMKAVHATAWLSRDWRLVKDAADFLHGFTPFYKFWAADPARKCCRRISRVPTHDPDAFFVPLRFAFTSVPAALDEATEEEGEAEEGEAGAAGAGGRMSPLTLFRRLVLAAGGGDPARETFILNYLAHLLQRPLELPGVALILTGAKGCGKDTLLNFVVRTLLGPALAVSYDRVDALFNTFDVGSMHKVVIKVEELSAKSVRPFAKALRSLITADARVFNNKNGAILHNVENYARFLGTSNEACPVPMYDDHEVDRRFFISPMQPDLQRDAPFWAAAYHARHGLFTPAAGRAVGDWLMARDLTRFNPRLLPASKVDHSVERGVLQTFVEDGWAENDEWLSTKQVWEAAKAYCALARIDMDADLKDTLSLGKALAVYVTKKSVRKRVGGGRVAYYCRPSVQPAAAEEGGDAGGDDDGHYYYDPDNVDE